MSVALILLLAAAQLSSIIAVGRLYRDNCNLRSALLTVSRPEVAAVVRQVEKPATDEPEEPARRVIYR